MINDTDAARRSIVAELAEKLQHLSQNEAGALANLLETKWRINLYPWRSLYPIIWDPIFSEADENKIRFDVVVTDIGSNRLGLIKEVRSITGLGVLEISALAESMPLIIARGAKTENAKSMKRRLEDIGASVNLKPV